MILSASGWRKIFVESGKETDTSADIGNENSILSALIAESFSEYLIAVTGKKAPVIVCGRDTRPTGEKICNMIIKSLLYNGITVEYAGIVAAPEIMAFSRQKDGFIYVSASHNPIGHNGIKFGYNDGGVLDSTENAKIVTIFEKKCADQNSIENITLKISSISVNLIESVYNKMPEIKKLAVQAYKDFLKLVITDEQDPKKIQLMVKLLQKNIKLSDIGIVADMNGSARTLSIDSQLFSDYGISFYPINNIPGKIEHAIIPEPENLIWCAQHIEQLQKAGVKNALLGYMPDCDGDRGNIVYWDETEQKAKILKAQEVFSLSVLASLCYGEWQKGSDINYKPAIIANGPTSMRIEEIASKFNVPVFRSEVGEANVVNMARKQRNKGYTVRILGEGSNGGTIVHPEAVRDPLNTIFLLIQLLTNKDKYEKNTISKKGLFHIWCENSSQMQKYKTNFSLSDIINSLPNYITTGVSEPRAVLHIKMTDQGKLKSNFQNLFEAQWPEKQNFLKKKFNIGSYKVFAMKGTELFKDIKDFSISGKGGLKIIFYDLNSTPAAYIWMRGSGTEPVFRILCDVKGNNKKEEEYLLNWETEMLEKADK